MVNLIKHTHRGMTPWFDEIDRWFDTAFAPIRTGPREGAWIPSVDISEDNGKILVKVDLPGVDEKDLSVKVEDNVLVVSGERKFEKESADENFHRFERVYGSFERSFTLPESAATDKISAKYDKGVLRVEISKIVTQKKAKVVKIG